jgi:hypothetical protein
MRAMLSQSAGVAINTKINLPKAKSRGYGYPELRKDKFA